MPERRLVARARARALISRSFFFEERERPVISPFFTNLESSRAHLKLSKKWSRVPTRRRRGHDGHFFKKV